jgi:hypothetical protein
MPDMPPGDPRPVLDYGARPPRPRWWTYPLWWIGTTLLVVSVVLALTMLVNFLMGSAPF